MTGKKLIRICGAAVLALLLLFTAAGCRRPEEEAPPVTAEGYVASADETAPVFDAEGNETGTYCRGTKVAYIVEEAPEEGAMLRLPLDGGFAYLKPENVVDDLSAVVTRPELYVLRTVNLLDEAGVVPGDLVEKGEKLRVLGYAGLQEDGSVMQYLVSNGTEEGYIAADHTALTQEESLVQWNDEIYAIHASRPDKYGGGDGVGMDYFPFPKGNFEDNVMPSEVKALYLNASAIKNPEAYLAIADSCGINAFVVDVMDGASISYASKVMEEWSPSAYASAADTMENFRANVKKLKDAGYYLIARMTTFNDYHLGVDHPELCITDASGKSIKTGGSYWPSVFSRKVWQYKAELALEAAELGFNEVQFDYVRSPNGLSKYEQANNIDYHNLYGETKAQAIQRFLAYAANRLHAAHCYISADVYGESANGYITSAGQYWPAISAVVDAISGMPYPDQYRASGSYRPWEHPYETLKMFGTAAMARQAETASPAVVRTWIQAFNSFQENTPHYGPTELAAQIQGLHDAGCTGGYMTWNGASPVDKYRALAPAFD